MKGAIKYLLGLSVLATVVTGCEKVDVFEKNIAIPQQKWSSALHPEINFSIADTSSLYNIYVVVRHTDAYRYNNLWMNIYTQAPGAAQPDKQVLDLQLATNEKGWLGTGMDDIFEHRVRITARPVQLKPGLYRFRLEQIMRDEPLDHVLNVGLRVERAKI
ncbi:gliding motility lipoprotein GldH [Flavihumibacter rivuli]|uniref:gliding motility lipoprotein GldH n=1 Tax=Flavihumibacter rivuli TaxID=2838156 RepID=UPI001BDE6349|nr:gliding motility lipoprotein GldH [Flavihumibacter rivuli]ULQ56128.1 gliding motility lipoprotein GldH [Flavihumibacter rivuli]